MKKILVPFDCSAASFNAVYHAIRVAQQTRAQLAFLWSPLWTDVEDVQPGPLGECAIGQQPVMRWQGLHHMLKTMCANADLANVEYLLKESLDGDSLERVLQTRTFDLLVIGMEPTQNPPAFPHADEIEQRTRKLPLPVLRVPAKAPFQSIGTLSLVTDSLDGMGKQALTTLFDVTEAFGAYLQIIYAGRQPTGGYAFRQAMKKLDLTPRLDAIRHTYHSCQPGQQALKEMTSPFNTQWLVLFNHRQAPRSEREALGCLVAQSRVPVLQLPMTEVTHLAISLERLVFTEAY